MSGTYIESQRGGLPTRNRARLCPFDNVLFFDVSVGLILCCKALHMSCTYFESQKSKGECINAKLCQGVSI